MTDEKRWRYVIFGAGAVGSAVGGLLSKAGSRVVCIARSSYASALQQGVQLNLRDHVITTKTDAVTSLKEITPEAGDVVVITTKSQSTESAISDLSAAYDNSLRIVCLQNGVRNEETASRKFKNVYAGLVFFSAVQLEPQFISLPQGLTVAIGCYPQGVDAVTYRLRDDLERAGFDALASAYVMQMKWGKLVANLNNATHAITGYWLERGMADPEMRRLMLEVREEGLRVLDAAGIAVEPPANEPSPIRIREMTGKLKEPPKLLPATDLPRENRTYASMWQDLQVGRRSGEAEYLNGEIVRLGRQFGIETPYNQALLQTIRAMFDRNQKPGIYSPLELRALVHSYRE